MQNSRGLTFIGMLLTMTIVIVFGVLLMRIVPVYLQHYEVVHSLSTLSALPKDQLSADPSVSAIMLKKSLLKQFEINSIDDITAANVTVLLASENKMQVSVKYQAIRPFVANISLLFNFENSEEVTIGSE